ncbi:hypothetical protein ACP275_09G074400 [Erythranthe tilingii]
MKLPSPSMYTTTAFGAAYVARPDAIVVDIDGDGSFTMNVQDLGLWPLSSGWAELFRRCLYIKIMLCQITEYLGHFNKIFILFASRCKLVRCKL